MARNAARGNILGFVLIGTLLTGLLVGGIFYLRHRNQATGVAVTDQTVSAPSEGKSQDVAKTTDNVSTDTDNTASQESDLKKALEAQSSASAAGDGSSATSQGGVASPTPATSGAGSLPVTGPEDAVWPAVGAASLVGVGIAFVRSRRLT